jgi:hypothetical protein
MEYTGQPAPTLLGKSMPADMETGLSGSRTSSMQSRRPSATFLVCTQANSRGNRFLHSPLRTRPQLTCSLDP